MSQVIADGLDKFYLTDSSKYETEVAVLKKIGYKIYRNPDGKHKVIKPMKQDDIYSAFGGIFGDIFKGAF